MMGPPLKGVASVGITVSGIKHMARAALWIGISLNVLCSTVGSINRIKNAVRAWRRARGTLVLKIWG